MWTPVHLPFERDDGSCPGPLPTVQEIRASNAFITQRSGQTVVSVTPDVLVKFGRSVKYREGHALLYLERYVPRVPAPRLYAMYYNDEELFLVMQRMPGVQLDLLWDGLSENEKLSLKAELRTIFEDLRNAECPWPDFFGALDRGPGSSSSLLLS